MYWVIVTIYLILILICAIVWYIAMERYHKQERQKQLMSRAKQVKGDK